MNTSHIRRGLAFALAGAAAVGILAITGCASGSRSGSRAAPDYLTSYTSRDYASAYDQAAAAAGSSSGAARDEAALVAGLSAHALERPDEAERWLSPLRDHADAGVSGRASATLGLIEQSRGNHEQAVGLLTAASDKLAGDEAARAALFAGDSYAAMGQPEQARAQYARAQSLVRTDASIKEMIAERQRGGTYTVQLGAFASKKNAQTQASKTQAAASKLGLGAPRVVQHRDTKGRQLYAVRVGRFSTAQQAQEAMGKLGMGGIVARVYAE